MDRARADTHDRKLAQGARSCRELWFSRGHGSQSCQRRLCRRAGIGATRADGQDSRSADGRARLLRSQGGLCSSPPHLRASGSAGTGRPCGRSFLLLGRAPAGCGARGEGGTFRPGAASGARTPVCGHDSQAVGRLHTWPPRLRGHGSTMPLRESRHDPREGFGIPDCMNLRGMMKIKNYLIMEVSDLFQTKY